MKTRPRGPVALFAAVLIINAAVLLWLGVHCYRFYSLSQAVSVLAAIPLLAISWFAVYRARHKHAQDALRLQDKILTNMSEGLILTRAEDGIIVYTNRKLEEMFGYSPGEMVGKHVSTVNAPTNGTPEASAAEITGGLNSTGAWSGRVNNIRKDGTTFWCYASVSQFNHHKHGRTLVGVHTDITAHRGAEQALRESEERFRAVFEKAGNPIVILDAGTLEIKDFNDEACNNLGYTRDEFAGLSILDINAAQSEADLKKIGQAVLSDGGASFETKHRSKMGEVRDVSVTMATAGTRNEKLCVSIWQDITDRKKVMDEIQRLAKFPAENLNPVLRVSADGVLVYANQASSPFLDDLRLSIGEPLVEPWNRHVRESYSADRERQIEEECGDRMFSLTFAPIQGSGYVNIYGLDITERRKAEEDVRTAARQWESTFEAIADAVCLLDKNRNIVKANTASAKALASPAHQLVGRSLCELVHGSAEPKDGCPFLLMQETGRRQTLDLHVDGRYFSVCVDPVLNESGEVIGGVHVVTDTTRRKKVEEEKNKLLKAVETAREAVNIATPDGDLIYTNEAMDKLFGYDKGELIGKNAEMLNAGSTGDRVLQHIMESIQNKDSWEGEIHNKRQDGTEFFSYATVSATRDNDGHVLNIISTQHDITEQKRMMEALRESEERFRMLFEQGPLGMAAMDQDLRIVAANAALCRMLGYSLDELSGLTMPDITHPEDVDVVKTYAEKLFEGRISRYQAEKRYSSKDDRVIWGNLTASMIPAPEGKPAHALAVIEDITERKNTEQKVRLYQKQLRSLGSKLTLAEERQRKQIATALHDGVCQTLGMAKMKLDLLRSEIPLGQQTEGLAEACRMLSQAIGDTRTLTFDLSSPILYELGLEAALGELVGEHMGRRHGISCEFEDDERPKPLDHDTKLLLYQSVRELLVNVVKYAEADKVKVSVHKDTDTVEIVVEDDGVGFDAENDVIRPDRTGQFGLFSIRERLGYLGGRFEIESKPNRGTKAVLTAPLSAER